MLEMLTIKQSVQDVGSKRIRIIDILMQKSFAIKNPQLTSISTADLKLLFELYDDIFFHNWFRDNFKGQMKFSLSRKMTKSAGKTMCPKSIGRIRPEDVKIEIRIGVDFFLLYGQHTKSNVVCGIKTQSSLEALMLVFEHELCHVLEFLLFHKSSCKGARFKTMANNVFLHTDSYHKLPTNRQIAGKVFGYKIGDTVSFKHKERKLTGMLYNIHKRAVVLVPDRNGSLADKQGVRYSKYYVPVILLEPSTINEHIKK